VIKKYAINNAMKPLTFFLNILLSVLCFTINVTLLPVEYHNHYPSSQQHYSSSPSCDIHSPKEINRSPHFGLQKLYYNHIVALARYYNSLPTTGNKDIEPSTPIQNTSSANKQPLHDIQKNKLHTNITQQKNDAPTSYSEQHTHENTPESVSVIINNIPKEIVQLKNYIANHQTLPEWQKHTETITKRNDLCENFTESNMQEVIVNYNITHAMRDYSKAYSIDINTINTCNGNKFQQAIHSEFVTIADQAAHIWYCKDTPRPYKKITRTIADFINIGTSLNKAKEYKQSLIVADACWMLLDCVYAAGEGIFEGIYSLADDISHPIRTVQALHESVIVCGHYVGKAIIKVGQLGYCACTDADEFNRQLHYWDNKYQTLCSLLREKREKLTLHDAIKNTASFGVQFYAAPKILRSAERLFSSAQKYIKKLTSQLKNPSEVTKALSTPEGFVIRIANNTEKAIENTHKKIIVAHNTKEFFKTPFGKLFKGKIQRTNREFHGNPIYKVNNDIPGTNIKKGHIFYLDKLHLDHLEIFNRSSRVCGVYNLDGTFNQKKYDAALAKGRRIDMG